MKYEQFIQKDDFEHYHINEETIHTPKYLQIELTDHCNLTCQGCVRSITTSKGNYLNLQLFKEILNEAPDVKHVSFVGAGEALMHPEIYSFIYECSSRGIYSTCNTNGILVERKLKLGIEAGLGKIAISVDAAESELLKTIRSGLSVHVLRSAMNTAVKLTENTNTRVSAAITLSQLNLPDFPQILSFVSSCGIREVTVESMHHWGNDKTLNQYSLFHSKNKEHVIGELERGLERARELKLSLRIFDYTRILRKEKLSTNLCPWPYDSMYVTAEGDVTPCCIHIESDLENSMGNVNQETITEIWKNNKYDQFRRSFNTSNEWHSCRDCVYRMEYGKEV